MAAVTIINVGYRSTNYWVISAGRSRLLVDLGWPGTFGRMRASLDRMGVPLHEIRYGLATHYHIDHAGIAQELKQAGVPLLVMDVQVAAVPRMKTWIKPQDNYLDITLNDNVTIPIAESRALLARIGIAGEILHTPGHTDDSVSLLLDDGAVFTGDLPRPAFVSVEDPQWLSRAGAGCRSMARRWSIPGTVRSGRLSQPSPGDESIRNATGCNFSRRRQSNQGRRSRRCRSDRSWRSRRRQRRPARSSRCTPTISRPSRATCWACAAIPCWRRS